MEVSRGDRIKYKATEEKTNTSDIAYTIRKMEIKYAGAGHARGKEEYRGLVLEGIGMDAVGPEERVE